MYAHICICIYTYYKYNGIIKYIYIYIYIYIERERERERETWCAVPAPRAPTRRAAVMGTQHLRHATITVSPIVV